MSENLLAEALALLRRLEWCDAASSQWGEVSSCPVCHGIPIGKSLNMGGGYFMKGEGHKPDCELAKILEGAP